MDLVVGMVLLVVGVLSFAQTLIAIERMQQTTRETGRATQAARAVLEAIQAEAFPEAFRRYNRVAADDPGGTGTAPGAGFAVPGLNAQNGDADGLPGEVVFPTFDALPGDLREDVLLPALGMPRDLNGDGLIDGQSHTANYRLLPVLVRVRWRGVGGPSEVTLRTIVGNY